MEVRSGGAGLFSGFAKHDKRKDGAVWKKKNQCKKQLLYLLYSRQAGGCW